MQDFDELARKMRCKFHFDDGSNETKNHPFLMKSGYEPTLANNAVENYILATKVELGRIQLKKFKDNLLLSERKALQSLCSNTELVIKKSDKNASTVILDRRKYIEHALTLLNDNIHYERIPNPNTKVISKKIEDIIRDLHQRSFIDDLSYKYLTYKNNMQHGRLYLLPKIHKIDLTLRNAIKTNKMLLDTLQIPGRPIVSLCNSPLERVGHFVDYFLKEIVCTLWTYTKDTTSFINKVEKIRVPNHAILSNFDISSMYSNLNHHEIIEAINRAWPKIESCKYEIPLPPKKDFLELVRIIVENNEFEFSNQIYRQKVGVPMGARPSPSLTDLRMFELISEILKKFTHSNKILHLSIYRDDGFIIFDGEEDEIKQLFEIANNIHPLIKFTHEISTKNIQFLDVTVYKGNRFYAENILDFKLYRKPTDNYQYLE